MEERRANQMEDFQEDKSAYRGSREQIEILREINAQPETTVVESGENNRRIHEHLQAIEERGRDGQ
jgi:hypothetical protein